ncbi:MAG: enoyl-CoA hydratase/isomerase family protein [Anaerolineales bacterium]|nr:enoyl-CoA hydratase/isomerase family protein [Anaerolineales bacterium]
MSSLVLLSLDPPLAPHLATITLNRPTRHNSLIPELLEDLLAAFEALRATPGIRAVVLQANGRTFSTGGDLQGFANHLATLEEYSTQIVCLLNQVILTMLDFPVPILTAVHGIVTGGSLGFVLASDVVLVSEKASFTPYYSVVGFSPDGGWTALLPHFIGLRRTSEILLNNETITAEQAVAWGLANRLVPAEHLATETLALAHTIATHKPLSLQATKQNLRSHLGDLETHLNTERERFVQTIMQPETQEGMLRFLNRNKFS